MGASALYISDVGGPFRKIGHSFLRNAPSLHFSTKFPPVYKSFNCTVKGHNGLKIDWLIGKKNTQNRKKYRVKENSLFYWMMMIRVA